MGKDNLDSESRGNSSEEFCYNEKQIIQINGVAAGGKLSQERVGLYCFFFKVGNIVSLDGDGIHGERKEKLILKMVENCWRDVSQ